MNDFAKLMASARRLAILKLLASSAGYSANEYLLHMALPGQGHNPSAQDVRDDLAWLWEQKLVQVDETGEMMIAKITQHGLDVQDGRAFVEGVKRPVPS